MNDRALIVDDDAALQIVVSSADRQAGYATLGSVAAIRLGNQLVAAGRVLCPHSTCGPDPTAWTRSQDVSARLRFPACATAPGGPKPTSRYGSAVRPTRRRPYPPLLRRCRRD